MQGIPSSVFNGRVWRHIVGVARTKTIFSRQAWVELALANQNDLTADTATTRGRGAGSHTGAGETGRL